MQLRCLTYNIQAAIGTRAYKEYLTQGWRQLFHSVHKNSTLESIAELISDYDVVCIQEVDLGGRRSNFKCQVDVLLELSSHIEASSQQNRVVGNVSRHGNAIFSKYPMSDIQDLKLPGRRQGRGAIVARIEAPKPFHVMNVHMSLGVADQMLQVDYLIENAPVDTPLIIKGDFNCGSMSAPLERLSQELDLKVLTTPHHRSYPSWKPRKDFDHILMSPHFFSKEANVVDAIFSDHRPVEALLRL